VVCAFTESRPPGGDRGLRCALPRIVSERDGAAVPPPLWINLEYLSAESWVAEHHGLHRRIRGCR